MATMADLIPAVRLKLRDFARAFESDFVGDGMVQILETPVVMVDASSLQVVSTNLSMATPTVTALTVGVDYTLDAHHGDLVFARTIAVGETINVFGRHFRWLLDSDIEGEAAWFIESLNQSAEDDYFFANFGTDDPRFEMTVRGVLVGCLWNLLVELSFDIDTRTAEGVDLPVSQRFAQVEKLIEVWTARYQEIAEYLNIGIQRISMSNLRMVSRSTGRYVPVYVGQEFDDQATPQRIYPLIDDEQGMLLDTTPPSHN